MKIKCPLTKYFVINNCENFVYCLLDKQKQTPKSMTQHNN